MSPCRTPASLQALAEAALLAADLDLAGARADEALARAEAEGDPEALARATALCARVCMVGDQPDRALAMAERAASLSRAIDDRSTLVRVLGIESRVLLSIGQTDAALAKSLEALELIEGSDDLEASTVPMCELANIYGHLGQWRQALEFGERFCETARLVGRPVLESAAVDTVAWIHGAMRDEAVQRGDQASAMRHATEAERGSRAALGIARKAGNLLGEATCLANLAESLSDLGHHQDALDLLDGSDLEMARLPRRIASHHGHTRGIVLTRLGREAEAVDTLRRAVDDAQTGPLEITARRALAEALERTGELREALLQHKVLAGLVAAQNSEKAQRAASIAAVRLDTAAAHALVHRYRTEASHLQRSNEQLNRRSEDWRRQALEDPLTGLPNRRRLDELLAARTGGYSVVVVDLDRFKGINDSYSHQTGDAVLRAIAGLLRANGRHGDLALRFGGEEFALLLSDATADGAMAAAERTRRSIATYAWETLAPGLAVTASFGVAIWGEAGDAAELLNLADQRMYVAKTAGRDRVIGPEMRPAAFGG